MAKKRKYSRPIEYCSPPREVLHEYARFICKQMAANHDPSYADPEIVRGLAEFMKIAGNIQAKHLNRKNLVDNDPE